MARIKAPKSPKPIIIDKFLGVNESVGETQIEPGETVRQENFRITKNYKLQKKPGFMTHVDAEGSTIHGMWYGKLLGVPTILFVVNSFLYRYDLANKSVDTLLSRLLTGSWDDTTVWDDTETWDESANPVVVQVCSLSDERTHFFWYGGKVYIKNTVDYKTYDGTICQDVEPYVPTVAIGSAPDGTGGVPFEVENALTGRKGKEFLGNGVDQTFILPETDLDADLTTCTVNGVTKVENTDYTVNRTAPDGAECIFSTFTPPDESKVYFSWVKDKGNKQLIMDHQFAQDYGVENDTNIFIYGNPNEKHVFRYSMVGKPNYFPVDALVKVASDQFAVTGLLPQYQSLVVTKENQTKIVRPTPNPNYETNTGLNPYNFPYFDLNEAVGNSALGQGQIIENSPMTLYGFSFWAWSSNTSVEDERNAEIISDRIKLSLQEKDLSQAITHDNQFEKEYMVNVDGTLFVYNYGNNTFYMYTGIDADQFIDVEGVVYYIEGSKIKKFDRGSTSDDGEKIRAVAYSGFDDFNMLKYRKMMHKQWISIEAASNTSVNVSFITDRKNEGTEKVYRTQYLLHDFNYVDYNKFSFLTNRNPQVERLKAKVKKFTTVQWKIENYSSDETLTFLEIQMQAQVQGEAR